MENYIETISKFPINLGTAKQNLSRNERTALKNLKSDNSIVLKEADKGGAIVIMDKDYYKDLVLDQLHDEEYYKKLQNNMENLTKRRINKLVSDYSHCLTDKEESYLKDFVPKNSNFYGLPKIHKSKQIQSAIREQNNTYVEILQPDDLKLRPIVAGPESITQRLSHFIDLILKDLCPQIPSYIKDDMDFLKQIPSTVPENTILTSFDVQSLYTNIPHELGITAIKYWLNKKRDQINSRFDTNFIIEALKIVLEENVFYFDGTYYRQIKGTAMGTKVAPTYANLVMGYLEQHMYNKVAEIFDRDFSDFVRQHWKRYLDDCIIFWSRSEDELLKFKDLLNSLHPSIKFTMESNRTELPFLDILIKKSGTQIITDIYYKPTDTHQYLNFHSCHPSHTKRNIPYCMARRICAIVSDEQLRINRLEQLRTYLTKQMYPKLLVENGIKRAKELTVTELRTPKNKQNDTQLIPFVCTHDPKMPNVFSFIKSSLPILHRSENMKQLVPGKHLLYSRRQPKNLKKHLTRAKFDSTPHMFSVKPCGDSQCGVCGQEYNYFEGGSRKILKDGKIFNVNADMNCKTRNLIYCITCVNCKENYIGQTGNSLCERVRVHKEQIKHPQYRQIPLSKHLQNCGQSKFKIMPIFKCNRKADSYRKEMERFFIGIFKTKLNP